MTLDLSLLTEKRCHRCSTTKPVGAFRKGTKKGVAQYCRDCEDAYHKQRRAAARDIAVTRVTESGKTCIMCREHKPASAFSPSGHTLDGWAQRCDTCRNEMAEAKRVRHNAARYNAGKHRMRTLKYKYGLTELDYLRLTTAQGSACAICRVPFAETRGVCVDHSHSSGEVRGLLCHPCNTAVGFLKDSSTMCRLAAEYLDHATTQEF